MHTRKINTFFCFGCTNISGISQWHLHYRLVGGVLCVLSNSDLCHVQTTMWAAVVSASSVTVTSVTCRLPRGRRLRVVSGVRV